MVEGLRKANIQMGSCQYFALSCNNTLHTKQHAEITYTIVIVIVYQVIYEQHITVKL